MKGVRKKKKNLKETIYFTDEDEYNLLKQAKEIYGMEMSCFLRKIISFWLWSNKLKIMEYDGRSKRGARKKTSRV